MHAQFVRETLLCSRYCFLEKPIALKAIDDAKELASLASRDKQER